jgi:exopolysaccharide biosynthesis WecB/TagA/CpsF family protein
MFNFSNNIHILIKKRKIVSALNGNFLRNLHKWPLEFSKDSVLWVDGLIGQFVLFLKFNFISRKPGYYLLIDLLATNKNFLLIGTKMQLNYFKDNYPSSDFEEAPLFQNNRDIVEFSQKIKIKKKIIIIGISTPKQELLAIELYKKKCASIFCLGGALNMFIGVESRVPQIISFVGLEWLWRLHNEPLRRFARLLEYFLILKNFKKILKTKFHETLK